MATFIDTHCHLDAPEFGAEMPVLRARAAERGVAMCVIPAVAVSNFATVRELAHVLKPVAGIYEVRGFGTVRWKVQKTTIKDPQGNVVRTIG